ncbi:MAG: LacI family DNA-binding transcriptional regulator [Bifidobacterium aquikefiri]|uniref:LacI family transcriptional regulator n=1 Tax=Bifidobacterium aquikefiri TaxID=1653207 RepID=A0A261G0M2_9BIFI|nr:LacI family DNA-binding transcriptional regulator [Bifidobacterium aquikefiri]OZG64957.1 LacI family transcriptional regulator [Bifidobacterium aquikefiri]
MNPSINDVARKVGVSISTVSRSFTHPEMVSQQRRQEILRISRQMGFSISRSATALKSGLSLRIAMLISDSASSWFNASVYEGLNEIFHPADFDISLYQIKDSSDRNKFFETLPTRRNADAVIVNSFDVAREEAARLESLHVPLIGINSASKGLYTASTAIDDVLGAQLSAKHLIHLGHTNMMYVQTGSPASLFFSVERRKLEFMRYCADADIPEPKVITVSDLDSAQRISDILSQILVMNTQPTAIVCQEDDIAIPLIFQLNRCGIRVPEDISVIGFDNSTYADSIGLTTIAQDPCGMAKEAARMTLKLIRGEQVLQSEKSYEPKLILRSSTGRIGSDSAS